MRSTNRFLLASASLLSVLLPASHGGAQDLSRATPVIGNVDRDYPRTPVVLGDARIFVYGEAGAEYDSNIYASDINKVDDLKLVAAPTVFAAIEKDSYRLTASTGARFERFLDRTTEDSTAANAIATAEADLSGRDSVNAVAGWERIVESRGDPEARNDPVTGPRLIDVTRGEATYSRIGTRIGARIRGTAARFNHVSQVDEERDHDSLSLSARVKYAFSELSSAFGEIFVNDRNFRLAADRSGVNRDSSTTGFRAGIDINPGGVLRGEAGVGLFRFNPEDPTLKSRTGVSAQAALIYQPRPQLAFTLDVFNGDAATVRSGAYAREDTRVRLGYQHEIRRNMRAQIGAVYRRSAYLGTTTEEETWGGYAEAEYIVNRRFAIAATTRFADRKSSNPAESFERLRGAVELRFQF